MGYTGRITEQSEKFILVSLDDLKSNNKIDALSTFKPLDTEPEYPHDMDEKDLLVNGINYYQPLIIYDKLWGDIIKILELCENIEGYYCFDINYTSEELAKRFRLWGELADIEIRVEKSDDFLVLTYDCESG